MESQFGLEYDSDEAKESSPESGSVHHVTYNEIAKKLIRDKFLLTALELHAELIESGRELPSLREFFSNPGNFENQTRSDLSPCIPRSSSQATLDSLDFTRFSEDGERGNDERVALLEFELRKAKETINALRADLTVAAESDSSCEQSKTSSTSGTIRPHEQRALNFLINEYLLVRGYKLTSITFTDENEDQDFEDWDDVGLNMSKPDLVEIYRSGMRQTAKNTSEASTQADKTLETSEETVELRKRVEILSTENMKLLEENEILKRKMDVTVVEIGIQSTVDIRDTGVDTPQDEIFYSPAQTTPVIVDQLPPLPNETPIIKNNFLFTSGFESKVWSQLPALSELNDLNTISSEKIVYRLAKGMPLIIQNISMNKKELLDELVVLLVALIYLHPDPKEQESLLNILLNLKKRPQEEERRLILAGLVKVAETNSDEVIQGLLLPQCYDLMTHKYPEKRLLVAQASAYMTPYISSELRDSLLLSMLQQILQEDREESVKVACVVSLAVITSVFSDSDKYSQIEDLTLKTLEEMSETVLTTTLNLMLPVLARWAFQLDKLYSHLVMNVMSALRKFTKENKDFKANSFLNALISLLPYVVMFSATAPEVLSLARGDLPLPHSRAGFSDLCHGLCDPLLFNVHQEVSMGVIMAAFDSAVKLDLRWPQLDWILGTMIPSVLDLSEDTNSIQEEAILGLAKFFKYFCIGFGEDFSLKYVKFLFDERIQRLESSLASLTSDWPSMSLIPIYSLSFLVLYQPTEIGKLLERFLIALSLSSGPLEALRLTVRELSKHEELCELVVMPPLWQGVVHQRSAVRCVTAQLLVDVIPFCPQHIINNSAVPALITLASDPEISVKVSAIPAFSVVVDKSSNKEVLDKSYLQIQSIVTETSVQETHTTLLTVIDLLGKLVSHCDPVFREEVIVPELGKYVLSDKVNRPDITAALVEAYSNTIYCQISNGTMSNSLLPALRLLLTVCSDCLPTHQETVSTMIKEVESRVETTVSKVVQRSTSSSSIGMSPSNVEDMKQRVSKIFSSPRPTNLPNLPNLFKKK